MEYVVKTKVGWLKMLVFSSPADSQIAITQYPAYAFHMQEPLATATVQPSSTMRVRFLSPGNGCSASGIRPRPLGATPMVAVPLKPTLRQRV